MTESSTNKKFSDYKITGIIPAAGFSSRFGSFKPALLIDGKPLVLRAVETLFEVCDSIIVVGGYNFDKLLKLIPENDKIKIIFNPDYELGMFSSVKKGVLAASAERYFLLPGDYGFIKKETPLKMISLFEEEFGVIIPSFKNKKGHPALFNKEVAQQIKESPDNISLKEIFGNFNIKIIDSDDKGILQDIDTPEDFTNI